MTEPVKPPEAIPVDPPTGFWSLVYKTLGTLPPGTLVAVGVAALLGYMVVIQFPAERESAMKHGDRTAKYLGEAIKEQTDEMKFHNKQVRDNQAKMIEAMTRGK